MLPMLFLFKTLLLDEKHDKGGLFPIHFLLTQIFTLLVYQFKVDLQKNRLQKLLLSASLSIILHSKEHKPEVFKHYLHRALHTQWEHSCILGSNLEGIPCRRSGGRGASWAPSSAAPICTPNNSTTDPGSPFLLAEVWP